MAHEGFAAFYASSYRRLLGQLFAVTGDLAEALVRRVAINLAALPLAQRQVIVLHHLVGLPVEEVARELRLATGTVKSRLARGRAAMAGMLDHERSEVT